MIYKFNIHPCYEKGEEIGVLGELEKIIGDPSLYLIGQAPLLFWLNSVDVMVMICLKEGKHLRMYLQPIDLFIYV